MGEPKRPDIENIREAVADGKEKGWVPQGINTVAERLCDYIEHLERQTKELADNCKRHGNEIYNLERRLEAQGRTNDELQKRLEAAEAFCEFVADLDEGERPNSAELDERQKRWLDTRGDDK